MGETQSKEESQPKPATMKRHQGLLEPPPRNRQENSSSGDSGYHSGLGLAGLRRVKSLSDLTRAGTVIRRAPPTKLSTALNPELSVDKAGPIQVPGTLPKTTAPVEERNDRGKRLWKGETLQRLRSQRVVSGAKTVSKGIKRSMLSLRELFEKPGDKGRAEDAGGV